MLLTEGAPEASISWELIEKNGWSLDAIATSYRAGIGISKDIYKNKFTEIDLGAYVTNDFKSGEFDPKAGLGINISF